MSDPKQGAEASSETLWPTVRERARTALDSGALQPVSTECHIVRSQGISWIVRVLGARDPKRRATEDQRVRGENPFLPYDPGVFVANISESHVALLNKFNVIDHHLLLVTREFRSQDEPLDAADYTALWRALAGTDGLAFYNGGTLAGASQAHKHLQVVPTPLGPGVAPIPIEPLIASSIPRHGTARCAALPFPHALASTAHLSEIEPEAAGEASVDFMEQLRASAAACESPSAYNLLVTRRFALWVPRVREQSEGVSVNALGFAGCLLVRDAGELDRVRALGPLRVLAAVAGEEALR